eukprot:CAMPEP_0119089412 /NCGR_PEP_ID=MMETSP1178-20130426/148949_1 /TAXON_ID=33656 /ORGANISM="unid sp, Strain CCMP2000" /LENGTH=90 /DNA_ID=CAMNT_0007072763 /DNA_START=133 /DNA_END=401 /DNA_ORIENTATION=-
MATSRAAFSRAASFAALPPLPHRQSFAGQLGGEPPQFLEHQSSGTPDPSVETHVAGLTPAGSPDRSCQLVMLYPQWGMEGSSSHSLIDFG